MNDISILNRYAPYGTSFWLLEVLIGAVIPIIVLLTPGLRKKDSLLLMVMVFVIIGIVVNRWNVIFSGLIVPLDWSPGIAETFSVNAYRPSWFEWGVATGVAGYIIMAFSLGLRFLPFFSNGDDEH